MSFRHLLGLRTQQGVHVICNRFDMHQRQRPAWRPGMHNIYNGMRETDITSLLNTLQDMREVETAEREDRLFSLLSICHVY